MDFFKELKNVKYSGEMYSEEFGSELPVFTLVEQSGEEWNAAARTQNIKMFISEFHKLPLDYDEVQSWVRSLFEDNKDENHLTANEMAFGLK